MANINKSFKCAKCSTDFSVSIITDLEIEELTMISKCPKCTSIMQIHMFISNQQVQPQTSTLEQALPIFDDSIFTSPEMPSEEIKKLIEG